MFRFALIGTGNIARDHIEAYRHLDDVEVTAVIGRNPETAAKCAEALGCKWFSSIAEAKKEVEIDVADICLPTNLHESFVIEAARAGCHVLCEKPVTFTPESFDRMVRACEDNGVRFMVAQVVRWAPEYMTVKDFIREGKLGNIHMIYEKRLSRHPAWATWHRDPEASGGGLYDINVHDIDYLYSLFGKPETVYANGWKSPSGCWNHVVTNLRWANGVRACVESSLEMTGSFPFSVELRVTGDKGTLSYCSPAGVNSSGGKAGDAFVWYPAGDEKGCLLKADGPDMFEGELREFLDAIKEGREAAVTFEQNRGVLEVLGASLRSLEENVIVTL